MVTLEKIIYLGNKLLNYNNKHRKREIAFFVCASAPARDEFPGEIFTSGYGSGDFALVGDYALNDEGTNITNTLNDIALRIRLYGDLKINHITADVNNNFTFSGIGGGTLF